VLAFHLWPTIFAGAPFRLRNICRNGVPPRSRTTTTLCKKWKTEKTEKTDMLRSIGKQSGVQFKRRQLVREVPKNSQRGQCSIAG